MNHHPSRGIDFGPLTESPAPACCREGHTAITHASGTEISTHIGGGCISTHSGGGM
jgi:hypothetical protein